MLPQCAFKTINYWLWYKMNIPWNMKLLFRPASVAMLSTVASRLRWSASPGSRPGLARLLCRVIAVYTLRLNSRAGTDGSTVSSLICDRWLILGSETLSIQSLLEPLLTYGLLLYACLAGHQWGGGKVRGARCEVVKCEVPVRGRLWLVGG